MNLIILRGLPGSGKTTLAKLLTEETNCCIFSVDDYFTNPDTDEYQFNFSENHFHEYGLRTNPSAKETTINQREDDYEEHEDNHAQPEHDKILWSKE